MLNSNVWFKCWIQILDLNIEFKCLIQMLDLNVKLKCWNHVCFDRIYWSFWSCFYLKRCQQSCWATKFWRLRKFMSKKHVLFLFHEKVGFQNILSLGIYEKHGRPLAISLISISNQTFTLQNLLHLLCVIFLIFLK